MVYLADEGLRVPAPEPLTVGKAVPALILLRGPRFDRCRSSIRSAFALGSGVVENIGIKN